MDLVVKKPKCRRSAYIYFVKDYQKQLKETRGKLPITETSKLCAVKWKHLPMQKKEKYKKLSEKDGWRYKKEMKDLTPQELKILKKSKKNLKVPVRPMSAYLWFCKSKWKKVSEANPGVSCKHVMKELAKLWKECNPKTREKFELMAECDRKCYQTEKEKYRAKARRKKLKNKYSN